MDTTLLVIVIWLSYGLIGVSIDLIRNKHTYKGSNLFHELFYILAFVAGGGFTMGIVIYELTEKKK
jgi:Na+/H+ antiporter NhaA